MKRHILIFLVATSCYRVSIASTTNEANRLYEQAQANCMRFHSPTGNVDFTYDEMIAGFDKAEKMGSTKARHMLGSHYLYKDENFRLAAQYFKNGEKADCSSCMRRLGILYRDGSGVIEDYQRAFELFQKSSFLGDSISMHLLATMHSKGPGTKLSYPYSYAWANLSASYSKYPDLAIEIRNKAKGQLSSEELAEAQELTGSTLIFVGIIRNWTWGSYVIGIIMRHD